MLEAWHTILILIAEGCRMMKCCCDSWAICQLQYSSMISMISLFMINSWRSGAYIMGPLARYVKLRVAHAPGMPGTFSPSPWVSDPDMHHGTWVTHVPWYMSGSLTSGFLWSWWRGKRSRHCPRMRNPQFYVSGKRPIYGVITDSGNRLSPIRLQAITQTNAYSSLIGPIETLLENTYIAI